MTSRTKELLVSLSQLTEFELQQIYQSSLFEKERIKAFERAYKQGQFDFQIENTIKK